MNTEKNQKKEADAPQQISKGASVMLDAAARAALESSLMALRGSLKSSVAALKHEALSGTLESILKALKHDPRMTDIIDTHQALNTLEGVLELPKTSLARVFGLEQEEKKDDESVVRPD